MLTLNKSHPLAAGLQFWLPSQRPHAGGGRWLNIARPYNDGTLQGTCDWARGSYGGLSFRGNGSNAYVICDQTNLGSLADDGIVIAVSLRWTSSTNNQQAFCLGSSTSNQPLIILGTLSLNGGQPAALIRNDVGASVNPAASSTRNDGRWHRLFLFLSSTSGGSYRFSIDGVSESQSTLPAYPITVDRLAVGALWRSSGVSLYFAGDIADPMIWIHQTVYGKNYYLNEYDMMRWDYEQWSRGWPDLLYKARRPLIFLPSGGSTYTGSGAVTIGAATCSGSATFTAPVYTGSAAVSVAPATASGSATHTTPTYTGSAAVTCGAATASGTATFTAPTYTGSSVLVTGNATLSGTGTFTAPVYTGTATLQAAAATATGTGIFANQVYTGTGALQAPVSTVSGTGTFEAFFTGTAALQAAPATASGTGTFEPFFTGTAALQTAAATVSGTGVFDVSFHQGTGTLVTAPATASGTGTYTASIFVPDVTIDGMSLMQQVTIDGMTLTQQVVIDGIKLTRQVIIDGMILRRV